MYLYLIEDQSIAQPLPENLLLAVDDNQHRDPHLKNVDHKRLWNTPFYTKCLHQSHLLRLRDLYGRRGRKSIRARGDWCLWGNSIFQTVAHMNSQRLREDEQDLNRLKPTRMPALRRGAFEKPHPNQEAVCNWYLVGEGKPVSLMECYHVYQPHSRASHAQE